MIEHSIIFDTHALSYTPEGSTKTTTLRVAPEHCPACHPELYVEWVRLAGEAIDQAYGYLAPEEIERQTQMTSGWGTMARAALARRAAEEGK